MSQQDDVPIGLLGGGISALAFAYYSGLDSIILEKEDRLGGLCRSFDMGGVSCDIGPHIFFSRNDEALEELKSFAPMHRLRRSNKILYKGEYVKYPFENDLYHLPVEDRRYCVETFVNNPYEGYDADNMLTFFYRTFGEGITRCYLEPYNRKIWKFEPAFMDLQMVGRIPKPPPEDIIRSAEGESTEGYTHQLHFWYPQSGGAESVIRGLRQRCGNIREVHLESAVEAVRRRPDGSFEVTAGGRRHDFPRIVSTIPLHELLPRLTPAPPPDVQAALQRMYFNSIHITVVNASRDNLGDNFSINLPDPEVPFHRLNKLDFLGEAYHIPGTCSLMVEITYRKHTPFDLPQDVIAELVVEHLDRLDLVPADAVNFARTMSFPYAYVIYDKAHRENTDKVLAWLESIGIMSIGRFGAFVYINTDQAIVQAKDAASRLLGVEIPFSQAQAAG